MGRSGYICGMTKANHVTTVRETERKYEAPDAVKRLDPAGWLKLDTGAGAEQQELTAVYFDTADLRLIRAGITLRHRAGGTDAGWHLKFPAGDESRDELQVPDGTSHLQPPAELVGLTRVYTRDAALAPVAQLTTQRRRWILADPEGHPLAELVDDLVHAQTMGRQTRAVSWRELEVELAEHGQMALLDRIERKLLKRGARRSRAGSKLGRLLAEDLPDRRDPPGPGSSPTAGDAVLAYLRIQADQLCKYDPMVRRDLPDAVHQMRVAARRMRSALQAFGRIIDKNRTRGITRELKWLAGELAAARDTEVMAQRCRTMLTELPDDLVLGPVAASMTRTFERRQRDAHVAALAALDSDRYLALHNAIDALLADPPLTRAASRPGRRELPASVARAYRRTKSRMRVAASQPAGVQRNLALHETRKAAKRLRYATEAVLPTVGKPAERLQRRLKKVQKLLGEHQDTVVSRPVLRELAVQAHLEGGNGFTYGLMHAAEATRAAQAEQALPASWKRMRKPKNTTWLHR